MSAHTSGPWVSVPSDAGYEDFDIKTADDEWFVATAHAAPGSGDPKANGDLIAAAPDLLAALKDCLAHMSGAEKSCGHQFECVCVGRSAAAAIARAEGRQP